MMGFMNNRLTQMMKVDGGAPVEEEKEKEKKSGAVTGAVSSFLAAMQNMSNATGQKTSLGTGGVAGDANTNAYIDAIQNMTGQTEERRAITADGDVDSTTQPIVDENANTPTTTDVVNGKVFPGATSVAENASAVKGDAGGNVDLSGVYESIARINEITRSLSNKTGTNGAGNGNETNVVNGKVFPGATSVAENASAVKGNAGGNVDLSGVYESIARINEITQSLSNKTGANGAGSGEDTSGTDNAPTDKAWPGATPVAGTETAGEGTGEGPSTVSPETDKTNTEASETGETNTEVLEPQKVTVPKVQASMDGAGGYGEFLKNYGSDTGRNFAQAVRAANDDYYRALMTYGKNAEALAGNGLTGAGVSDYGSSAAYAARQGAVAVAGAAKQQADAENARSYAEYLQNYRAQQEAAAKEKNAGRTNTFNAILAQGITDPEVAKTLLRQSGYFSEEEVESLGGQAAAYSATQVQNAKDEATSAQNATNNAAKTNIYNSLLQQGLTDVNVVASQLRMSGLFTEEEIAQYSSEIAGAAKSQQDANDSAAASAQNASNNAAKTEIYNSLLQQGLTDVNVVASQLRMSGLFTEEEIAQYSSEIAGAAKSQQDAEENAADSANEQAAQDAYNSALANGASPSEAKTYIESQFGKDVAEQVAENAGAMVAASFEDSLKVAESSSTYTPFAQDNVLNKAVLDQQLATGMISQEQYNGYLTRVQALNEKWLMNVQTLARNEYRADDAAAMLGITLGEDADEIAYMDASIKAARDAVIELYENGAISSEAAARYFAKDFDGEVEGIADKKDKNGLRDVCDEILSYKIFGEQVDADLYWDLLERFGKKVVINEDSFASWDGYKVTWNGKELVVTKDELAILDNILKAGSVSGDDTVIVRNKWVNIGTIGDVRFTYNQLCVLRDLIYLKTGQIKKEGASNEKDGSDTRGLSGELGGNPSSETTVDIK